MAYTVDILQSESSERLYVGHSENLERRLKERQGQTPSARGRGPWRLLYERSFLTRAEAVQHERRLKSMKSRRYILDYISSE